MAGSNEPIEHKMILDDTQVLDSLKGIIDSMKGIEDTSDEMMKSIIKHMEGGATASEAFAKAIADAGKKVDDTRKDVENSNKELQAHRKELVENIKNYKVFGVSINDIQGKLKAMRTGLKAAAIGTSGMSKAMKVLKLAIASTGIGLLVIALGSLVAFFTKTQAGAEKIRVVFKQIGAAVAVVVDRFSAIGKVFSEQGIIKGVLNLGAAFKGVNEELREEIRLTKILEQETIKLEKAEVILNAQTSERRAQIKELNKIGEDTLKTDKVRISALTKAGDIEKNLLNDRIKLREQIIKNQLAEINAAGRFEGIQKLLKKGYTDATTAAADFNFIQSQLGLSESNAEDVKNLVENYNTLFNTQAESAELQTTLQNKLNTITQAGQAAALKSEQERQRAIDEINKALKEQVQLLEEKVTAANLAALEGADQLFASYQLAAGEVLDMKENLENLFEQAGKPLPEDFEEKFNRVFQGLNESLAKELKDLPGNEEFKKLPSIFEKEFDRGLEATFKTAEPSISLRDAVNGFFSDLFGGASLEDLKTIEEATLATFGSIADGLTAVTQEQLNQQDILLDALYERIDEQQSAVDEQLALKEQGFANNLDAEKAYLEELQAQRVEAETKRIELAKKAANQQLVIDTASQISALATSAANYFKATSPIPFVGIALAISAIASMYALFAKAKAQAKTAAIAPQLREGAQLEGPSHEGGGIPINVRGNMYEAEGGEWIIGTKPSKEHSPFLNRLNSGEFSGVNLDALVSRRSNPLGGLVQSAKHTQSQRQQIESGKKWEILKTAYLQGSREIVSAINGQPIFNPKTGELMIKKGNTLQRKRL